MPKTTALGWGSKGTNALEGVPSPGISSSKLSKKPESAEPKKPAARRKPAPTAEPRLRKGPQGSSIVRSTADPADGQRTDQA